MKPAITIAMRSPARLLAVILLLPFWTGCNRENPRLLPREMAGVWTTHEPRYQGRFLELSPSYVMIGTGPTEIPKVQVIDTVKREKAGEETAYTINSTDLNGEHYEMTLLFNPAHGGELHFKNQANVVWRRYPDEVFLAR